MLPLQALLDGVPIWVPSPLKFKRETKSSGTETPEAQGTLYMLASNPEAQTNSK